MGATSTLASLFGQTQTTIHTDLAAAECAGRLKSSVDSHWSLLGDKPVVGTVGPAGARLRKRLPPLIHNSFQSVMQVRFSPEGKGLYLRCSSGMSVYTVAFMVLWLCIILGVFAFAFAANPALSPSTAWDALGMAGFGFAVVFIGRVLAIGEHDFLARFICRVADGRIVEDKAP